MYINTNSNSNGFTEENRTMLKDAAEEVLRRKEKKLETRA